MTLGIATIAAPWGAIHVAASERGVVAMQQLVADEAFAADLARRYGSDAFAAANDPARATANDPARAHCALAIKALEAFLEGDLDALDDLPLDLSDRSAFDRAVFDAVRALPPGTTASYGDIARMIGKPGAARAVGGAVGRCPIGLAIPCHRVIAGDGSLGGYGEGSWGGREAGLELKRELLEREGVSLDRR